MESFLTIEQMARRAGLSAHALRYYERIGLIRGVPRGPGGQRRYGPGEIAWVEFLLRLRNTGMPIAQMREFAALRHAGDATAGARRAMLERHLGQVRTQLDALVQAAGALESKIAVYRAMEGAAASASSSSSSRNRDAEPTIASQPVRRRTRPL